MTGNAPDTTSEPQLGGDAEVRLPGELSSGAPLASPQSAAARSDPGGFVHLLPLDGLRGMAIGLILIFHLFIGNNESSSRLVSLLILIKNSLWIGVDLFFALSGFLITGILFDALHSRHFLRNFYGRRCVRIFPLYFLALAVLGLLSRRLDLQWHGLQWYLIFYLANLPGFILHLPNTLKVAIHLWSLSTEEQFYLLWPFVVLVVRDRRRLMLTALVLSVVSLCLRSLLVTRGVAPDVIYVMLPTRMDGLLIGGWLALAIRGPERAAILHHARSVFIVSALLLLALAVVQHGLNHETSRVVNAFGYTMTSIASTALIASALVPRALAGRIFSAAWMRGLGRYSYGIYVWHPIVGALFLLKLRFFAGEFIANKVLRLVTSSSAAIAISVLMGILSYYLFEVHFLRLKRFFAYGR